MRKAAVSFWMSDLHYACLTPFSGCMPHHSDKYLTGWHDSFFLQLTLVSSVSESWENARPLSFQKKPLKTVCIVLSPHFYLHLYFLMPITCYIMFSLKLLPYLFQVQSKGFSVLSELSPNQTCKQTVTYQSLDFGHSKMANCSIRVHIRQTSSCNKPSCFFTSLPFSGVTYLFLSINPC